MGLDHQDMFLEGIDLLRAEGDDESFRKVQFLVEALGGIKAAYVMTILGRELARNLANVISQVEDEQVDRAEALDRFKQAWKDDVAAVRLAEDIEGWLRDQ